jgi:hypothetical protein
VVAGRAPPNFHPVFTFFSCPDTESATKAIRIIEKIFFIGIVLVDNVKDKEKVK